MVSWFKTFFFFLPVTKYLKDNEHDTLNLVQKYARLFVHGYYLFLEAHPTAKERLLFIFSISDIPQFVNFMSNKRKFLVKNLIQNERAFCYCDSERDIYGTCFFLCIAKLFKRYRKHSSLHLAWKYLVHLSTFSVTLKLTFFLELHLWKMVHFS